MLSASSFAMMEDTNQPESCAPKKRALLVDINYASAATTSTASSGELKCCHRDVSQIKDLLMKCVVHFLL